MFKKTKIFFSLKPWEKLNIKFETTITAMERHNPEIQAAANADEVAINIYSTIGEYGDGQGMTAKIVSSILRQNPGKAITVNINSPGGDFFEGVAINTLLSSHDAPVNINIVGIAASAASVIAMAGDTIEMGEAAYIMIHNAWTVTVGDKNTMEKAAEMLTQFDGSMAELYSKASGVPIADIENMMNDETWLSANDSIAKGFATGLMDKKNLSVDSTAKSSHTIALRKLDISLAKVGMPRSERRALIKEFSNTPSAVENATQNAGNDNTEINNSLKELIINMKT